MGVEVMETQVEVKTFLTKMKCTECPDGSMEVTSGMVRTSYPPQYPHECNSCGRRAYYVGVQYPVVSYEEF